MTGEVAPGGESGQRERPLRPAGRYEVNPATGKWHWSSEVYALHGIQEGGELSTVDVLRFVHAADVAAVRSAIEGCLADGAAFSAHYRLRRGDGERRVLLVGEGSGGPAGSVAAVRGFFVDTTAYWNHEVGRKATAQVSQARATQEVIDQARGVLMLLYGLDADAAFSVLTWQSQRSNVKVRRIAQRLVEVAVRDLRVSPLSRRRLDERFNALPAEIEREQREGRYDDGAEHPPPEHPPSPVHPSPVHPSPDRAGADRGGRHRGGPDRGGADRGGPVRAREPDWLDFRTAPDGSVTVLLSGEIDLSTAPELERRLLDLSGPLPRGGEFCVDLTKVSFLGAAGIAVLTSARRRCVKAGVRFKTVPGTGPAASALARTPLHGDGPAAADRQNQ